MPVSKKNKKIKKEPNKKTLSKKGGTKKKADPKKKIRKEIKNAVDQLPSLIIEQVKFENQSYKRTEESEEVSLPIQKFSKPQINNDDKTKKMLMWLFVFIITAVVFSMWFWNMTVMFKDVSRNNNTNNLLNNVKTNYEEIMNSNLMTDNQKDKTPLTETDTQKDETLSDEEKNKLKSSIKESLDFILFTMNSSTDALGTSSYTTTNTTTNNITTSSLFTTDNDTNHVTTSLENL